MEYLIQHTAWLEECLGEVDDDYFIIDCPGQIEIYTHMDLMRRFVSTLEQWDIRWEGANLHLPGEVIISNLG